jgi:hypothetical protein
MLNECPEPWRSEDLALFSLADPDGNMLLHIPLLQKGGPKKAGRGQETEAQKRERYLKNFTC